MSSSRVARRVTSLSFQPARQLRSYSLLQAAGPGAHPQSNQRKKPSGPGPIIRKRDPTIPRTPLLGRNDIVDNKVLNTKGGFTITIPNIWLRDNCQCSTCLHPDTKQRLIDTFSIPRDISIKSSNVTEEGIGIEWSDGHKSHYRHQFISNLNDPPTKKKLVRQGLAPLQLWDASIASDPPTVTYQEATEKSLKGLLSRIRKFGFCYVDSTPATPEATEKLLERISFIRPTHYGGFYDFTADLASKDTAYTNIALEAHTDTTYFSDPAGLQAFHLLEHSDGEGGASLLVDGFKVAMDLRLQNPEAYAVLSRIPVFGHASGNDGISIQSYRGFPVFESLLPDQELVRVRWNSSDRAVIGMHISRVAEWYDAAREWDALLKKSENEHWEQLKPGRVLIFDNWRVLHGRSAFTGKRRICGGYINRDDWISKYKMECIGKERVLEELTAG